MSIVNFTSGINKIEQQKPLSEWAVGYIHSHSLSRENFATSDLFRNLSRREKDAIRYQLRKGNNPSKRFKASENFHSISRAVPQKSPRVDLLKIAKIALSLWISIFLLFDIVGIYVSKGINPAMAWQAAILVELCFVIASLSHKRSLRFVATLLLTYNALMFAFMEIDRVSIELKNTRGTSILINDKKALISSMKENVSEQFEESSRNIKRLGLDHSRGYVTSGATAFEKVSEAISDSRSKLISEVRVLESEVKQLEEKMHGTLWLIATSILYFLLRTLLQLFSLFLLKREEKGAR